MKKRFGCLFFVIGGLGGYLFGAFESRYLVAYIDENEAIQIGLENARFHCTETRYTHPVDCHNFKLKEIHELKTGWWLIFLSSDARRTDEMWVGRRGEYDSMGGDNLDGESVDGITENSPAPAPAKSKR